MSGAVAPRLYYMPRTRSSRVLWLLEEIGGAYELVQLPGAERRSEEHLRRHPLGRVPALELGYGTMMFESAAICLQLADLNPDAGLIPPVGSADRALVYQWVLLGMTELAKPPVIAARGGCWFASGAAVLHLGVEEPFAPARKAHPALLVDDLDGLEAALRAAGYACVRADGEIPGVRRFHTSDPFGNRVEFQQA